MTITPRLQAMTVLLSSNFRKIEKTSRNISLRRPDNRMLRMSSLELSNCGERKNIIPADEVVNSFSVV